jgi:hypothetical protein
MTTQDILHIHYDVQQERTAAQPRLPFIPSPGLQGPSKFQAGASVVIQGSPLSSGWDERYVQQVSGQGLELILLVSCHARRATRALYFKSNAKYI